MQLSHPHKNSNEERLGRFLKVFIIVNMNYLLL